MKRRATTGGKVGKARRRSTQGRRPSYADLQKQLSEALEQQTATSEVLKVISSSPGELAPVFRAMLENALHICQAKFGFLYRYDGQHFAMAAQIGASAGVVELMQRGPISPHPDSVLGRIAAAKRIVEVADATKDPGYLNRIPVWVTGVEEDGTRSLLGVPMLKENTLSRRHSSFTARRFALHRQADRAGAELRRAGGDRHREHAAAQRAARIACSSRPPPPTCSRSSAARRSICRPCSIRWSNRRRGCARPTRPSFSSRKGRRLPSRRELTAFRLNS